MPAGCVGRSRRRATMLHAEAPPIASAAALGLRAQVERSEADKASTRIDLDVSVLVES